jgi:hypothetical protein
MTISLDSEEQKKNKIYDQNQSGASEPTGCLTQAKPNFVFEIFPYKNEPAYSILE